MDVSYSLQHANQSAIFFEEKKIELYGLVEDTAKNYPLISRFVGLPIAICSGMLTLVERICTIVEGLIKGFANIFGSQPFAQNPEIFKGLKQLSVQIPNIVALLLTPATAGIGGLITTAGMLGAPETYCNWRKEFHIANVNDLKEMSLKGTYRGDAIPLYMHIFYA